MKAVIVEDEMLAARNLQTILEGLDKNLQVMTVLESVAETVEWFTCNHAPDIIFMDIHLADGSAFEIFNRIKVKCPVIFTTAYDEYALKAFKVNSIDYLLKPVDFNEVRNAMAKLDMLTAPMNVTSVVDTLMASFKNTSSFKTHFLVSARGDKLVPVRAEDIAFFNIDTGIVKAYSYDGKSYLFEYTLDELMNFLDPNVFFRANRQYIIARMAIKDIDLWFNSRLSINLKISAPEKVLISKARIPEFKLWFGGR
jgi:two-component system, LytTR family, response regulator LytT